MRRVAFLTHHAKVYVRFSTIKTTLATALSPDEIDRLDERGAANVEPNAAHKGMNLHH